MSNSAVSLNFCFWRLVIMLNAMESISSGVTRATSVCAASYEFSILGREVKNGSGFFQKERIVEQAGDKSSGQRADPVDSLMRPMRRSQRRPKGAGGVQSGTRERPGNEKAERNRQADAKAGDGAKRAFFIDGRSEEGEHKKKGCHAFKSYAG